jgi:hypothetical protein
MNFSRLRILLGGRMEMFECHIEMALIVMLNPFPIMSFRLGTGWHLQRWRLAHVRSAVAPCHQYQAHSQYRQTCEPHHDFLLG